MSGVGGGEGYTTETLGAELEEKGDLSFTSPFHLEG